MTPKKKIPALPNCLVKKTKQEKKTWGDVAPVWNDDRIFARARVIREGPARPELQRMIDVAFGENADANPLRNQP